MSPWMGEGPRHQSHQLPHPAEGCHPGWKAQTHCHCRTWTQGPDPQASPCAPPPHHFVSTHCSGSPHCAGCWHCLHRRCRTRAHGRVGAEDCMGVGLGTGMRKWAVGARGWLQAEEPKYPGLKRHWSHRCH